MEKNELNCRSILVIIFLEQCISSSSSSLVLDAQTHTYTHTTWWSIHPCHQIPDIHTKTFVSKIEIDLNQKWKKNTIKICQVNRWWWWYNNNNTTAVVSETDRKFFSSSIFLSLFFPVNKTEWLLIFLTDWA